MTSRATARKSFSQYKPLIIYSNGKTEVIGRSKDRGHRGILFNTKAEAIRHAEKTILDRRNSRLKYALERLALYERQEKENGANRSDGIIWCKKELAALAQEI